MEPVKRVLVAVLVVAGLVAAFFAADDYARSRIVNGISGPIELATGTPPTVTLAGRFALPQLLTGRIDGVTVEIASLPAGPAAAEGVVITATGVSTASPYLAESVEASGLVPLDAISSAYRSSTGFDGEVDPALNVWRTSGDALGASYVLTFRPVVKDSTVVLRFDSVSVGGNEVDATSLGWLIGETGDVEIASLALPDGLVIDGAQLTDVGAELSLTGTDVALTAVH